MKIGIFSSEMFTNAPKNSVGSSRIRCTWLLPYWPEAEEFKIGVKYDAVIFQKAYFLEYMKIFDGIKILDLCDPDWMEGKPVMECLAECDAVTVSSRGLLEYMKSITDKPVYHVDDRVDMARHEQKKKHEGRAKAAVWYGYHHNQQVLDGVLPTLKRLGLTLTVISDLPYFPQSAVQGIDKQWIAANVRNIKFDDNTLNDEIVHGGDFVLNNRPETGKFKFKSDNKTTIARALNMPVAFTAEDVERYMDENERKTEAEKQLKIIIDTMQTRESVKEYTLIIEEVNRKKSQ